jgi:Flp pilus assembly protein TadD
MPDLKLVRGGGALVLAALLCACANPNTRPDDGVDVAAVRRQAELAREHGRAGEALFRYQQAIEQDPEDRQARLGIARCYADLGKPELARTHLDYVLGKNAGDVDALEERGLVHVSLHNDATARDDLRRVVTLDAGRWRAWNGLGVLADLEGNRSEAEADYRRALAILPDHPAVVNNLGYSLIMAHRYAEAEPLLRRALVLEPHSMRVRNNLAISLAGQQRYDEAVEILAAQGNRAWAYNNVGYVALLLGESDIAIGLFHKAIDEDPSYYSRAAENLRRAETAGQGGR